jgi:hypothetical protein
MTILRGFASLSLMRVMHSCLNALTIITIFSTACYLFISVVTDLLRAHNYSHVKSMLRLAYGVINDNIERGPLEHGQYAKGRTGVG